jgi:hypothetical protein
MKDSQTFFKELGKLAFFLGLAYGAYLLLLLAFFVVGAIIKTPGLLLLAFFVFMTVTYSLYTFDLNKGEGQWKSK